MDAQQKAEYERDQLQKELDDLKKANHTFTDAANEEMHIYNLTMKVNRLEMLKSQIGMELAAKYSDMERKAAKYLQQGAADEFERQAGILGKSVPKADKQAQTIPNASFHNATYSQRIWTNQSALKRELDKLLQQGMIQGRNPRALAPQLRQAFGVSKASAERLMRTEMCRVQIEAQKQSYNENGFDRYEYVAHAGCCSICSAMNGKTLDVKKLMPGDNAPPMHPNCRCSTVPHMDRDEFEQMLDSETTTKDPKDTKSAELTQRRKARLQARSSKEEPMRKENKQNFDSMSRAELKNYATNKLKTQVSGMEGVGIRNLRETLKVLEEFEIKLGGQTINGLTVQFGGVGSNAYADFDPRTNTIHVSKKGNIDNLEQRLKDDNIKYRHRWKTDRDYNATETYSGTLWHELGHAIDVNAGQKYSKWLDANTDRSEQSLQISAYARNRGDLRTAKRTEAWAENYSAYMDGGKNKNKLPGEIGKKIEESNKRAYTISTGERERAYSYIQDDGKREPGHVNLPLVNTKKYHDKYDNLTMHKDVNESLYSESMKILGERNNTEFEDIVAIDARTGARLVKNSAASAYGAKHQCGFNGKEQSWLEEREGMYEVLHNHPNNSVPSRDDIRKLFERGKQSASTINCHNGDVYRLEKLKPFEGIALYEEKVYNHAKEEYYKFPDDKIEYETSMSMILE